MDWWYFFEPSMATLVHPQRIFSHHKGYFCKTYSNGFCAALSQSTEGSFIREAESIEEICMDLSRQTSINPHSIVSKKTIEFRMFESTRDVQLILLWMSICQQIAHIASKKKFSAPIIKDWDSTPLTPTGDIALNSYAFLPAGSSQQFMNLLITRRRQVATYWCRNTSLHMWLPFLTKWRTVYDSSSLG